MSDIHVVVVAYDNVCDSDSHAHFFRTYTEAMKYRDEYVLSAYKQFIEHEPPKKVVNEKDAEDMMDYMNWIYNTENPEFTGEYIEVDIYSGTFN